MAGTHGCGLRIDAYGDHLSACPRTGALPRRGHALEQAWVRVCREAVGADGRVVPQQWLAATTAPGVNAEDRRRLDFVLYGATLVHALCADATLVSPLARDGRPVARAADVNGAAIQAARRRKQARFPELSSGGPHRLLVLACEVGGRWSDERVDLIRNLTAVRARRTAPAIRAAATTAWHRRWWGLLSIAQRQRAVAITAIGGIRPLLLRMSGRCRG